MQQLGEFMKRALLITTVLASFTATLHAIGGTIEIHAPLFNSNIPIEVGLLLYACWHLVTVTLIGSAIIFFLAARNPSASNLILTKMLGYLWTSFGLVFVAIDLILAGPDMLLKLPQWILLIPIGLLAVFVSKQKQLN